METASYHTLPSPLLRDAYVALLSRSRRRNLRPDSLYHYQVLWRRVRLEFGETRPLSSIQSSEIQVWLNRIRSTHSSSTANNYRRYLALIFSVAIRHGMYLGSNPVLRTDAFPTQPCRPKRRLSNAEVTALLTVSRLDQTRWGRLWTALFSIMLLTGLRIREAALLQWQDFIWSKLLFKPSHQKRSSVDDILPITPQLEVVLVTWAAAKGDTGHLFPEVVRGRPRHFCGRALRMLKRLAARANISSPETVTTHALRRTFISHAAEAARGDHVALMQIARHRDLNVTRLYMPTVSTAVRDVSTAVARSLGIVMGVQSPSIQPPPPAPSLTTRILRGIRRLVPV